MTLRSIMSAAALLCMCTIAAAQTPDGKSLVAAMSANERDAAMHKYLLAYTATERSARTDNHAWTERVVETPIGRVRYLIAIDAQPLDATAQAQERARLAADQANPADFQKREAAQSDDEAHARQMLDLLGRGFVLENVHRDGADWVMSFRPDPAYSPASTEEKVLHGMSGTLAIDAQHMRLHHVEGRLPADVSLAFGLASVKAGSNFSTTKGLVVGQWRTLRVVSDIHGKAALFKTLSRNTEVSRTDFRTIPQQLTLAQAIAMVEQ